MWKTKLQRPSPLFCWHLSVQMFLLIAVQMFLLIAVHILPLPGASLHCAKAAPGTEPFSAQYLCVRLLLGRDQHSSYPPQSSDLTSLLLWPIHPFLCHVFPLGANPEPSPALQHEGASAAGRRRVHLEN